MRKAQNIRATNLCGKNRFKIPQLLNESFKVFSMYDKKPQRKE